MGSARTVTAATIIDHCEYELRDTANIQYTAAELLVHLNKCLELIYFVLAESNSELVATGSGSITTVAGTETYSLSSNSMGDFWLPYKLVSGDFAIYLTDSSSNIFEPLKMASYEDRFPYVQAGTSARSTPDYFYLFGANFGLLPIPDAVYTVTLAKYIPNFVPLTASTETMPYYNLFNLEVEEGVKMIAKNRQGYNSSIEVSLLELFQAKAMKVMRGRRNHAFQITPKVK